MINNIKLDENKLYINVKLQAFLNLIFFLNRIWLIYIYMVSSFP